ncbi:MAG TPA: phosphate ABC transporter permease PstA [Bacillota bacterium]|nr:phosphate ABC transporter permease PstA [Peptococcaceae bacterium MAG4]NLW39226.1 phosphate ABC transporter permease PstA [Peptococcaceae bacterium]HPZ42830.1 phosphate ABC transporter permease PstA [Bacillota bacterium]HQD75585.1 phosphate ABC transporter permease PstA [Bacillota bacterium]HUM58200.1 phosphate ABC transporter permease PstA [Bacillota bacterium]
MITRSFWDRFFLAVFWSAGLAILLVLTGIIGYLLMRGGSSLTLEFLTTAPRGLPLGTSGGVLPAIRGTLLLVFIAILAAAVPGLITAVYLSEYGNSSKFTTLVNITIQCMAGIPSIVTGLFGYAFFVVHLGFGISLLAGGLSLGIMIFPVVVLTARDALLAVNEQYRLAGTALGVSRWYMLRRVIIPQSATAILSGILLAMGYAAGATAPIMVTAAVISAGMSGGLLDPVMALPYHLYILFSQHISMEKAYGTALLLVLLLLFLNITALMLRGRHGKGGY